MPSRNVSVKSRVRTISHSAPTLSDVFTAFQTCAEPRDKAVLVAIAAAPDADLDRLCDLTSMTIAAVRDSVHWLMTHDHIFITLRGGYVIHTAVG